MYTYRFLVVMASCLLGLTSWKIMPANVHGLIVDVKPDFYTNPLVLNGKPLDLAVFSIHSRGRLALVSGDPASDNAVRIPFRMYLYRNGVLIYKDASDKGRQLYEIAPVMEVAQPGDDLVIDPVRLMDKPARRAIRLQGINWFFNWYSPGC